MNNMRSLRLSLFKSGIILVVLFLCLAILTAKSVFAITPEEVTQISERLESDSGALSAAAELAGADSDLVDEFQLGVKYGEFAVRIYNGDYLGVAVDFIKFEFDQEVEALTDLAQEKLLSAGAQRLVGVFGALKDIGVWLGEKALDAQFNIGLKAGYETYGANVGQADFREMMDIWWIQHGKGKMTMINDKEITEDMWIEKFAEIYAIEKKAEKAPATTKDIETTKKVIKKTAIVHFFKLKYPGIGINVAEELADAIVNKTGSAAIKQIAEKYKNHLDGLTVAGAEGGAVSSDEICEGTVEEQKDCLAKLQELIEQKNKVLSNEITYEKYSRTAAGIHPGGPGIEAYIGMPREGSARANNLINFKKAQERAIASAYEFQFGQEIRAINDSLAANKDAFKKLKNDYKNLPEQGSHGNTPSYKVSVNTGFVGFFNNIYNMIFHYGSFDYEDFKSGAAQKNYQEYLEGEPKANAADDARARYLKAHLGRANGLVSDLTFLQNRINSLISSAESSSGVFSYGLATITIDDLKEIVSEIEELKQDIQFGERPWWSFWRSGAWSIDSVSEAVKEMDSDKKARESRIDQLKKEHASALKTYEGEEKRRELEKQKQAEEEKKAAAEKEAQALQKQKSEEEAWNQEKARLEAEKQAAAEKARLEESTKAFNVPFGEGQKATPNEVTPTPDATQPATTPTKPTPLPTQPPAQTQSATLSGQAYVPNENEEIAGFSFITQWKADMMISDFFWTPDGIYTVNGALDIGSEPIDLVTSVPTSGYRQDPYQPEVGHVYAIKTRDGKYGIIKISSIDEGYQLNFSWRYQPDGSNSFW